MVIRNPGGLPPGLTVEDLRRPHSSHPRNPLLAQAFYFANIVERWGSGTTRMAQLCREQGLPEPEFASTPYQFTITFRKDPYTPERLRQMGLSERQMKAVQYVRVHGSITNVEYRELAEIKERTAGNELTDLYRRGIFNRTNATGRSTRYILKTGTNPQ